MDIKKKLDNMLEEKYELKENQHKHITYIRKIVLKEAKEKGLIKDYELTNNIKSGNIYFGSLVGYDKMYRIYL